MNRLRSHFVGIDQGDVMLFSDFQDGGDMWTGTGPRERRRAIQFSESYRVAPSVQATVSLWDVDAKVMRADLSVENITRFGCELVFRTWGDTRLARLRVNWIAIGELSDPDEWELY